MNAYVAYLKKLNKALVEYNKAIIAGNKLIANSLIKK